MHTLCKTGLVIWIINLNFLLKLENFQGLLLVNSQYFAPLEVNLVNLDFCEGLAPNP